MERCRDLANLAVVLQSKKQAATQPLQKFPRSYLGAERGREPLGGAGRPGAEPCGRGEEGRGGARRAAPPGGRRRGRVVAGLRDAGRGGKRSWETGFTTAGKPGGRGAGGECGACAVAPGSPALPLARRRSTLGALA